MGSDGYNIKMDMEKQELAVSYAALILADEGKEITEDALKAVVGAAGISVEAFVPMLFARVAGNIDVAELMSNVGSGSGAAVDTGAAAGGAAAAEAEEEKKESSESSDMEMGFSLFD